MGMGAARPAGAANFSIGYRVPGVWSGWWWPQLVSTGPHLYDTYGTFTPLENYRQWTGDPGPLNWERYYALTADPSAGWFGHCNGWAAAAILESEPRSGVQAGPVTFNVGEVKGLLTICHQGDPADYFAGARHDQGATSDTDLRAGDFHRALLYYLWSRHEGMVCNVTTQPEVWNYPAYAFAMKGTTSVLDPRYTIVTTTVWFADDSVAPDFVNSPDPKTFVKTYTYWVLGDPAQPEDAGWLGDSRLDHPQFVWHPAYQRAYIPGMQAPNPIDYSRVSMLAAVSAG
jgi:hypothetical protein